MPDLEQQLINSKIKRLKMESKYGDLNSEEQTFMPKICEKSRGLVQHDAELEAGSRLYTDAKNKDKRMK